MTSVKHLRSLVVLLIALVIGSACGGGSDAPRRDREGAAFLAALLTAGPVSDAGWYAGAYEGLQWLEDSLGAATSHQQTRTPAEFDEAMIAYASDGYDLIFAHGFEYQDAAIRVGAMFPETTIIVSSGGRIAPNVIPLRFRLEEGSYMAGITAGMMTATGIVGMVGGVPIPPAEGTFLGFEAGARLVNPDVEVLVTWIGSWDDVASAKEAAVAMMRRGADILIHNTDAASFGVFQAVRQARDAGDDVWAMGMNRDQNDVFPEVILGSAVLRIPEAFLTVAQRWRSGQLPPGEPYFAGGATRAADYVVNPVLRDRYSPELRARLEAVRMGIRDGIIDVPRVEFMETGDSSP
jgi:basic membrane lipoprotein Med (substrate-binding protein (PBP1-ABC) superfamily)